MGQRREKAIGIGQIFQVQPVPLDGIQVGRILGQPEHLDTRLEQTQQRANGCTVMIRHIIENQEQGLVGIDG